MNDTAYESIPGTWVDERDNAFFRLVARVFCIDFVAGAGVLLASYDADDTDACTPAQLQPARSRRVSTSERGDSVPADQRRWIAAATRKGGPMARPVQIRKPVRPSAPAPLDLRTPSGRELPY